MKIRSLYSNGLGKSMLSLRRKRELTVSELAGLIMAEAVPIRLRSWTLRHCSAPWFLRTNRQYKERRASLTACEGKQMNP